jgi:primase-polymerase (primpol)-like protein
MTVKLEVLELKPDKIPITLTEHPQFCLYRLEEKNGKFFKPPYQVPKNGRNDVLRKVRVNDPTTFCTFEEAVAAYLHPQFNFDGIGFVLTEYDPFVFIDLDHCTDPIGGISPRGISMAERIGGYRELSPIDGVHIIAKANIPKSIKRGWIEMYGSRRYMTLTGHRLVSSPHDIPDRTREVMDLYNEIA